MIAVLGTGRIGGAIGPRLAALDHPIIYGSRESERDDVQALVARTSGSSAAGYADAVENADQVVLAIPYKATDSVLSGQAAQSPLVLAL